MLKKYISIMRGAALAGLLICGRFTRGADHGLRRDQWQPEQYDRDLDPV